MRSNILTLTILIFILQLPIPRQVFAQSSKAVEMLNLLAFGGVAELKYKIGGEPGGEAVDLDDSDWDITYPGFKWKLPNTNVWFRSVAEIPEKIGGFSLAGRKMTLFLYIDNGGDVFVNGDSLGSFEWGTAEFVISENLQPGDKYLIAVRGINRPSWGKIIEYRIEYSGMAEFQKKLQDKVWGLIAAKQVAVKLSDRPQYWLKKINKVAEDIVKSGEFKAGDEEGFLAVFEREYKALEDLDKEIKEKHKIYAAGYAHIDLAWQWPWRETVEVVKNTTESVFNIMDRFPDFKYSMGQAHAYEWMEIYEPELFSEIQEKVKQGRWEIVGGQWVEPDGNIPSGESFVRQSLYGKRYFREKFGVDVRVCWNPDGFGFNWNLPQILARSGIDAFVSKRIHLDDTRNFPERLFWWQGPDGSKVMTYVPRDGYMHDLSGEQLIDFVAEEKKEQNRGKELVLYGVGNHGGGPTMDMLTRSMRARIAPAYPEMKMTTSHDFFDSFSEKDKQNFKTWNSELYLERFRGCYTTQAKTKKHNREEEVKIKSNEKLATIATLYGYDYPRERIFEVWRKILFNQFHDIIPGTSINEVYRDSEKDYAEVNKHNEILLNRSFNKLAENIDTRGQGSAVVIFNPLSWERTSPVELTLDDLEMEKEWTVKDEHGNAIPVQKVEKTSMGAKLLFIANDVPSYGYKVYHLTQKSSPTQVNNLRFNRTELENSYLHLKIDKSTGLIAGMYDKTNGRQVLSSQKGNMLEVFEDEKTDAWNIKFIEPGTKLDKAHEVTLEEFGPVRTTIKVVHAYSGKKKREPAEDFPSSFFTQYISLYDGLPLVEVRNDFDWGEDQKVLKVGFPANVESDIARYEIPYSSIERPTGSETLFDKARYEVPAQRWADLSDGDFGVALINDCKHGYDIKDNLIRLTLLRSSNYPDPMADRGNHQFKYALYPHGGDIVEGGVTRKGLEFNEPLIAIRTDSHKGILEKSHSFINITGDNVILSVLKKAEDDDDWIVRIVEIAGKEGNVRVTFDRKIGQVKEVNLIEDEIESVKSSNNHFNYTVKPNEIRTFKVRLD